MSLRLIACALVTMAACGTSEDPIRESRPTDPGRSPAPTETADDAPSVSITKPADGSTVSAGSITVAVSVRNFEVVNKLKLREPRVEGEGHVHFYIDVDEIPTAPGQDAGGRRTFDRGTYRAVGTTTYTWPSVGRGEHTFGAQLFQNGHTPLEPPVIDEVTVTVK